MGVWRGFEVSGRRVAVVAGDGWALGVTGALLEAGARVVVIGPDASPAIADLAARGRIELITEPFAPAHLTGAALVITAADDHPALAAAADAGVLAYPIGDQPPSPEPVEGPPTAKPPPPRPEPVEAPPIAAPPPNHANQPPHPEPVEGPPAAAPPPPHPEPVERPPAAAPPPPHPEPVEGPRSATSPDPSRPQAPAPTGRVILVGGGPGDPGLLTVAGLEAIRTADVIATDRLAPLAALDQVRPDAEIIDVGKIPRGPGAEQQTIEELLIDRASAGRTVVRLKGGDSFVFGRGGEEWQSCAAAGIPVTVIPGVTSASAAPAAAGVPLTHRTLSQGFTVVTGHLPPEDPRSKINWPALADTGTTLVIMMGMANLAAIAAELIKHGMDPATPALVVEDGTLPSMRTVRAPVDRIADRAAAEGLGAPATVVIGAVAGFDPSQR